MIADSYGKAWPTTNGAEPHEVMPDRLVGAHPELRMPARAGPKPDEASLGELIAELEAKLTPAALPAASG